MAQSELFKYFGSFLFPNIFKTFRIAVQSSRLMLAFIVVVVIYLAGMCMDINKTVVVAGKVTPQKFRSQSPIGGLIYPSELHCYIGSSGKTEIYIEKYGQKNHRAGVFYVISNYFIGRFNEASVAMVNMRFSVVVNNIANCINAIGWVLIYHTWYSVFMLVIIAFSLSIFGGAICRGAALQFSRDEKPGIIECLRFSLSKFISMFAAPLAPVMLVAIFGVLIFSLGLLVNIPWAGEILLAIFFIIVLLAGLLMTFAVIGSAAGFGLMGPVIAYENSDTFDAISKSFSYIFTQPWRLGFYSFLGMLYGAICYLFVRFFAFVLLILSRWFLELGVFTSAVKNEQISKISVIWPEPEFFNLTGSGSELIKGTAESIAAFFVGIETFIVASMVGAFVLSFYFSLNTIIYCLLRKKVDGVEIDEIYVEAEEFEEFVQPQIETPQPQADEDQTQQLPQQEDEIE